MYNRYIPRDNSYLPIGEGEKTPFRSEIDQKRENTGRMVGVPPLTKSNFSRLFQSKEGHSLTTLVKSLHLENIDSGDILLLLILLYLLVEGDDLELVIALGLALLMGLGEQEKD